MKTLKLLGIVLLSALFVLGMTACPEDPIEAEPEEIEGIVSIKVSSYGAYSGKELVASFNNLAEYDEVKWEWFKIVGTVESSLANLTGGTTNKFTPADAADWVDATYAVQVTATGYEGSKRASVAVKKAPAYVNYFGTWVMDAQNAANSKWLENTTDGGDYNETVVITETSYRIDSTKPIDPDDPTAGHEHFYFEIEKWEVATRTVANGEYNTGFKLTGAVEEDAEGEKLQHGYSDDTTEFGIYLKTGNILIHQSDRSKASDGSQDRIYERQE
jgi:hypothetical protein